MSSLGEEITEKMVYGRDKFREQFKKQIENRMKHINK